MRSIIIIVTFIAFVALVAQAWATSDVSKRKGKRSDPGVDREHHLVIINPVDVNGNPVNMQFDWSKARDPFRRMK